MALRSRLTKVKFIMKILVLFCRLKTKRPLVTHCKPPLDRLRQLTHWVVILLQVL